MNRHQVKRHNQRAIDRTENPFIPFCRNCGRVLRSESSIKRGFGPGCGLVFADRWVNSHPNTVGEGVKRKYSREEIREACLFWLGNRKKD